MIKIQLEDLMKRSLILLIVFFAFLGCSKDDKGEWWEEYVKNSEGIELFPHDNEYGTSDTLVLGGLKYGKLWVAEYSRSTKERLFEWWDFDSDSVPRNITIYSGYGEYNECYLLRVELGVKHKKDQTIVQFETWYQPQNDTYFAINGIALIYDDQLVQKFHQYANQETNYWGYFWYNSSFIITQGSYIKCISKDNKELFTTDYSPYIESIIPVSFEEGVYISLNHSYRYNIKTKRIIWRYDYIYDDILSDSKTELVKINENSNIWSYSVNITNYDGSKETRNFKINIETGDITEI